MAPPERMRGCNLPRLPLASQTSLSSSVWGAVSPGSNWSSDPGSIWGDAQNANMGFWDEAVKEVQHDPPPQPLPPPAHQSKKGNTPKNKSNANLRYCGPSFPFAVQR